MAAVTPAGAPPLCAASQPLAMILGSTQSYDDSVWLGYSEITLCTCWCPLHMHAKLCVFAVMVVRVGERIYREIFPSVAAKHTYEWLESIPRPARHCLSSRKILQDCMVTIPAGQPTLGVSEQVVW